MGRKHRLLAVAVVGAALVILAACGNETTPSAGGTTPPPSPGTKTWTEAEWTIVTPAGWTREDVTSAADAKKAIRYKDADGNYFTVNIDPEGSDFAYDALWNYEVRGTGFEVVSKKECTSAADESCADQDNEYNGYILWKTGTTPQKVGGHVWYFQFGNSEKKTTLDAAVFERIGESVRSTATSSTKTWTEAEYTIETPTGWTRSDVTSNADAKKAIQYKDSDGNYFTVNLDPLGAGYTYDALWNYEVQDNSFKVVSKKECKGTSDEACSDKDNRYSGYILWKTGTTPQKVGGHVWYFQFGNSEKPTIDDADLFETIAESVRVTG